jgi:hypothetical protein
MTKDKNQASETPGRKVSGLETTGRREFVASSLGLTAAAWTSSTGLASVPKSPAASASVRITHIEVHEVMLEYSDWIAYPLNHFYGPTRRTIYVAHTNTGLEGLGEGWTRAGRDSGPICGYQSV